MSINHPIKAQTFPTQGLSVILEIMWLHRFIVCPYMQSTMLLDLIMSMLRFICLNCEKGFIYIQRLVCWWISHIISENYTRDKPWLLGRNKCWRLFSITLQPWQNKHIYTVKPEPKVLPLSYNIILNRKLTAIFRTEGQVVTAFWSSSNTSFEKKSREHLIVTV